MIDLFSTIGKLKPKEKIFIRSYYTFNYGRDCKKLKLFELVSRKKIISNDKAAQNLYGKNPNSTFCQLKKRLKKDLLQFIEFFEKPEEFTDNLESAKIKCTNLLLLSDIIKKRGLFNESLNSLKEAEELALKYNFFELQVIIYDKLISYYEIDNNNEQLNIYKKKMIDSQNYLNQYLQNKHYYKELKLQKFHELVNHNTQNNQLPANGLIKINANNQSPSIKFWYFQSMIEFFISVKRYQEAQKYAIYSMNIIEQNSGLFSESEQAKNYLEMARINVYLNNYDAGLKYAKKVLDTKSNINCTLISIYELCFYAYIGKREYQNAKKAICEIEKNNTNNGDSETFNKCLYLKASLLFIHGKLNDSIKLLHQINTTNLSPSVIYSLKFLELMIIAERKDYYWYECKLDNLRKLLSVQKNSTIQRFNKLFQVFKTLLKTNFDFQKTLQLEKDRLNAIYFNCPKYSWNPIDYEIIRLDNWLKNKADKPVSLNSIG